MAAVALETRYIGAPCVHCGSQERYIKTDKCADCQNKRTRKWYAGNKEAHKVLRDTWRAEHIDEVHRYNDQWRRQNLGRMCAHIIAYNARKRKALPPWADRDAIQRIYEQCPPGHQVDHIIPLRGKTVSGLHVENNLQYLPGVENNKKGNRYA